MIDVIVNNSDETFTSDSSGAIATHIWELLRVGTSLGCQPLVITELGDGDPYRWP